jgi:hypothetical protein
LRMPSVVVTWTKRVRGATEVEETKTGAGLDERPRKRD